MKKALAAVLTTSIAVSAVPMTAWAEEGAAAETTTESNELVTPEGTNQEEGEVPDSEEKEEKQTIPATPLEPATVAKEDRLLETETPSETYAAPGEGSGDEEVESGVAMIGDVSYQTLELAIAAAATDNTETLITLKKGIGSGDSIIIKDNKNIILDLGGFKVERTLRVDGATLTVRNGEIEASQCIVVYGSKQDEADYSVLNVEKDVTINGDYGIIVSGNSSNDYKYTEKLGYGIEVNVEGKIKNGSIFVMGNLGNSADSYSAMEKSDNGPVVNLLKGADVNGGPSQGIALNGYATVNVKDGATITGSEAIGVKRGNLNISGGTLIATGEGKNPVDANNSGTEETGAAVSVTGTYNKFGKINVSITGGNLKSKHQAAVFVGRSIKDEKAEEDEDKFYPFEGLSVNINGGSFSGDPTSGDIFVAPKIKGDADGYTQKVVAGGTFTESVKEYVKDDIKFELQNGSGKDAEFTYYSTLDAAKAEAKEGAVITGTKVTPDAGTVTVTIIYNNGEKDTVSKIAKGETIYSLDTPTKSRYRFRGWTVSGSYISLPYTVGDSNVTIEAQWKKKSSSSSSSSSTDKEYSIAIDKDIDNGKVKVDPSKAEKGDKVTITVTPDKGYEISKVVVKDADGEKLEVKDKGKGEYTFTMPDSKVEIDAKFVKAEEEKPEAPAEAKTIVLTIDQKIVNVSGEYVVNDVAPIIRNERTMLPIRFVAKELGAEVAWDDALNKVTITKDDLKIELIIGSAIAVVNGENVTLDAPAFIENSRTYLPLRFVAENLGATVTWDAATQQVTIVAGK